MTPQTSYFPVDEIRDWVFDLDNTIYPARTNLFSRVSVRITDFVAAHYKVHADEARVIQKDLFHRYGTTMRGMMTEENIAPKLYLDFVHDIDLSDLDHDLELDRMLTALPGRKHIFTNGTVPHAENILSAYGLRHHFDQIFDIVAADYVPKPERRTFERFLAQTGIDPCGAVMIEDMAANLQPAAALGMRTVWLSTDSEWARRGADGAHVHHTADDLKDFLRRLDLPAGA
jgi:putative hydrolase of the HAD superfamily